MNQQPPSTAPPTPEQGLMITEEMVIKKITHVLKVYGPGEASQLIKDYKKVLVDYPGWKATENKLEQILLNYQEEQRKAKEQEHEMMCQVMAAMMSAVQPAQEKAAKGDRTPVTLPPELSTDRAMMLWRVLQEAGLVNDNYQPTVSRTKGRYNGLCSKSYGNARICAATIATPWTRNRQKPLWKHSNHYCPNTKTPTPQRKYLRSYHAHSFPIRNK